MDQFIRQKEILYFHQEIEVWEKHLKHEYMSRKSALKPSLMIYEPGKIAEKTKFDNKVWLEKLRNFQTIEVDESHWEGVSSGGQDNEMKKITA